jgi:REP element-mobilizing transposase RayT
MRHTYTQIHIQVVFAVEGRQHLIRPELRDEVQKYMSGIIRKREQKLLAIYCMPDHTHLLIGLRPELALSALVQDVQEGSAAFINRQRWYAGRFRWQEGFGAFSYGHSQQASLIISAIRRSSIKSAVSRQSTCNCSNGLKYHTMRRSFFS